MPHTQITDTWIKEGQAVLLYKKLGETPLETIERFRTEQAAAGHTEYADVPMTYAGRLDPMAEGKLLILVGEECKNKEKYLGLGKEYEVEILFGVDTDTHDVLGKILEVKPAANAEIDMQKYVGKFEQQYPAFSSKTVDGKALHTHAREGTLPGSTLSENSDNSNWPTKIVQIYSITMLNKTIKTGNDIFREATEKIGKLTEKTKGDFRKDEILAGWKKFEEKYGDMPFTVLKISVACSSGTYMRSLAKRIGDDAGTGAIAFSIRRTKIGHY